jgi:uncharacterized membrane protein
MQTRIVPLVLSAREDYYLATSDTSLSSSVTSARIPARAIGGKLREVSWISTSGDEVNLPRVSVDDLEDAQSGFYVSGNTVYLVTPEGDTWDGTLRLTYYSRPGKLVSTSAVATVASVASATITTAATVPSTFSASVTYDLVKATPGFEFVAVDQSSSVASGTTVTLSTAPGSSLVAGDYVCLAGDSPVPQCPAEFHSVLAQAVAARVLEALGDREGHADALAKLKEAEASALKLITNRVDGEPQKITNRRGLFAYSRVW